MLLEPDHNHLAIALRRIPLSRDAVEFMERLLADPTAPTYAGQDLPTLSPDALLHQEEARKEAQQA